MANLLKKNMWPIYFKKNMWPNRLWDKNTESAALQFFPWPFRPDGRALVPVYRTSSPENCQILEKFKIQVKIPSSLSLHQHANRFDRYSGPVWPVPDSWNKKNETVLTCFQIWIEKLENKKFLKVFQGVWNLMVSKIFKY